MLISAVNIGERLCNHGLNSTTFQCSYGLFPRASTAKTTTCNHDIHAILYFLSEFWNDVLKTMFSNLFISWLETMINGNNSVCVDVVAEFLHFAFDNYAVIILDLLLGVDSIR